MEPTRPTTSSPVGFLGHGQLADAVRLERRDRVADPFRGPGHDDRRPVAGVMASASRASIRVAAPVVAMSPFARIHSSL